MSQIMAQSSHHHTYLIGLISTAGSLLHEMVHHLPREVHHSQAVLPPAVLGSRKHVVSGPQLPQTTQPAEEIKI